MLLAPDGMAVCAEAGSRADALSHLEKCRPDLAIVDLSLEGEEGLALIGDLHTRALPALVYSMHTDGRHVERALAAGALGYVTKREISAVLLQAIREVAAGRRFLSPTAAAALAEHLGSPRAGDVDHMLSEQERRVYHLLAQGEGTIEIAAALGISTHTVDSYYARIQVKLNLHGMHALRRHAINHVHEHHP